MTPRRTLGSPHRFRNLRFFQLLVADRSLGPGPHDATKQLSDTRRRLDGIEVELEVVPFVFIGLLPHVAKLDRHGGATERRIQGW